MSILLDAPVPVDVAATVDASSLMDIALRSHHQYAAAATAAYELLNMLPVRYMDYLHGVAKRSGSPMEVCRTVISDLELQNIVRWNDPIGKMQVVVN